MPEQKKYCGLKEPLPQGYTRYGNRYECMKTGYGICLYGNKKGQGIKSRPPPVIVTSLANRWYLIISISLIIANVILIILIFMTPKKDNDDKTKGIKNTATTVGPSLVTELLPLAFL